MVREKCGGEGGGVGVGGDVSFSGQGKNKDFYD